MPYTDSEIERLDLVIDEINAQPLHFVVHLGDIGSSARACNDEWLAARKRQFERIRHPFVLVPGDNEWSDCHEPLQRLAAWRQRFCTENFSLGEIRQPGAYCEHIRWETGGYVFVVLNVPGSNNHLRHPEHAARMQAVFAWLDEAAAAAQKRDGLVVLMQANPFVTFPRDDGYAALRQKLRSLAKRLPGRLILAHGDTHLYRDDEPLPGLRRVEVWGSPFVGWLRGAIAGGRLSVESGR